jgi:ribosomal protein S18 acetylase RimI-like enzyme
MSLTTSNNVVIRVCRQEDLPAILPLLGQLGEVTAAGELSLAQLERVFAEMAAAPQFYLNVVAVERDNVVGLISVIFYRTPLHGGGTALINELVVDKATRGAGIGRRLVEHARAEAVARGMDELEVGTEQDNRAAQSFYARCGFDQQYVLLGMEF